LAGGGILNTVDLIGRGELSYLEFIQTVVTVAPSVAFHYENQPWPLLTLSTRFFETCLDQRDVASGFLTTYLPKCICSVVVQGLS
jgi:hypothetical protein